MLDFWKCDWTHHFVVAGMIHEAGSSRLIVTKTSRSDAYPIEVAWELYRKAYMDGMFPAKNKQLAYGSMYPMRVDLMWVWLTCEHNKALQRMLGSYTGE